MKPARHITLCLISVSVLSACITVRQVDDSNFVSYQRSINEKGATENAVVVFGSGRSQVARSLHLAPDSTSFFVRTDDGDEVLEVVSTESIQEISFRRVGRQFGLGFLAGAAVGAVLGGTVNETEEVCTWEYVPPAPDCWLCWSSHRQVCHTETIPTAGLKQAAVAGIAFGTLAGILSVRPYGDKYRFRQVVDKSRPYMTVPNGSLTFGVSPCRREKSAESP